MRPVQPLPLIICLVSSLSFAIEPYSLIDTFLSKKQLPRVLSSEDVDLNPNDPQPLFTPAGDFNQDGIEDLAISGIYGLPKGNAKYFLLVGTQLRDPIRFEKIYLKEFTAPVFLHKSGSTGEKDPGDQAFSMTACSHCTDGVDYYWNKKKNQFELRPWEKRFRRYQELPHVPELDLVPDEIADKALQIAGALKDVQLFVTEIKKHNNQLVTRVKRAGSISETNIVDVLIYEKSAKGEKIYDTITVDTAKESVIKRNKKKI